MLLPVEVELRRAPELALAIGASPCCGALRLIWARLMRPGVMPEPSKAAWVIKLMVLRAWSSTTGASLGSKAVSAVRPAAPSCWVTSKMPPLVQEAKEKYENLSEKEVIEMAKEVLQLPS